MTIYGTEKPAVYTAVLMDFGDELKPLKKVEIEDGGVYKKRLLVWKPEDEQDRQEEPPNQNLRAVQLIGGSLVGVASAVTGLFMLNGGLGPPSSSGYNVFLFALAWSSLTAATAYGVFAGANTLHQNCFQSRSEELALLDCDDDEENTIIDNDEEAQQRPPVDPLSEYNFAFGVFVGFCSTCTVYDALSGLPVISILCTAGLSAAWGVLMAVTCSSSRRNKHTSEAQNLPETLSTSLVVV